MEINTEEIRQRMMAGTTDLNQINQWIDEFNRLIKMEEVACKVIQSAQEEEKRMLIARDMYAEDLRSWKAAFNDILLAYNKLSEQQTAMVSKVSELVSIVAKRHETANH